MIDVYKQPRQDLGLYGYSFARYSEKCFTQIHRALYGDAMLVPFGGEPNLVPRAFHKGKVLGTRLSSVYSKQNKHTRNNLDVHGFSLTVQCYIWCIQGLHSRKGGSDPGNETHNTNINTNICMQNINLVPFSLLDREDLNLNLHTYNKLI